MIANDELNQKIEASRYTKERLALLYAQPKSNKILFGKPVNSNQMEAMNYLEVLSPKERIKFLGEAFMLWKAAMRNNQKDFDKMSGN